jgi:hypothetical protein
MENSTGRLLGEIAFYAAIGVLVILFLFKKYKQVKNTEKDKTKP